MYSVARSRVHRLDRWPEGQVGTRVIVARIKRLERGLLGDVQPIGEGVSELRIHVGAGWRLYFTVRGSQVIILLAGGSQRTQERDIERAKALASMLYRAEEKK